MCCNKSGPEDIYKVEIVNILFSVQIYKFKKQNFQRYDKLPESRNNLIFTILNEMAERDVVAQILFYSTHTPNSVG